MTRLETLIKDISDPSVAEALKLLGGSPTPGGSGEPADSYEEVATGLRDADGNMIFKRTFAGTFDPNTSAHFEVLDGNMKSTLYNMHDVKGYAKFHHDNNIIVSGSPNSYHSSYQYCNTYFDAELGLVCNHSDYHAGKEYKITVYYTHVNVQ